MEKRQTLYENVLFPFNRLMSWLGQRERAVLIAFVLIIGGIWTTVVITEEVVEGDSQALDEAILLSLRNEADTNNPIGPPWFEEIIRDFTALGGTGLLTLVTFSVVGLLYMQGNYKQMIIVLAAILGALLISYFMKGIFDRPRPDLVAHGSFVRTASFPSGHSLLAASMYMTLGMLLAQVQTRRRIRAFIILLSMFIVILVGFSRVYLGVHWPSDVLAGWIIGSVWALLCWLAARELW